MSNVSEENLLKPIDNELARRKSTLSTAKSLPLSLSPLGIRAEREAKKKVGILSL